VYLSVVILTSVRTLRSKFSWSMVCSAPSSHPLCLPLMLRVPILIFGSLCFCILGCVLSVGMLDVLLLVALGSGVASGESVESVVLVTVVMVLLFVGRGEGVLVWSLILQIIVRVDHDLRVLHLWAT